MDIKLQPDLEKFIDEQVRQGVYECVDDAVNAGVAKLQTEQELSGKELDVLRSALDEGLAEADRGDLVDFTAEEIIAERRTRRS